MILISAQDIMQTFDLKPRDSLHYASMEHKKIKTIVTDDRDFNKIKSDIKIISAETFIKNL